MIVCGSRAHLQDEAVAEVKVLSKQIHMEPPLATQNLRPKKFNHFYFYVIVNAIFYFNVTHERSTELNMICESFYFVWVHFCAFLLVF